jgi:endopeptidase La
MELNIRDFKLFCFQKEYNKYNGILSRMQNHILALSKNNIIGINDRNLKLSDIYRIISEINKIKNEYLIILEEETCWNDLNKFVSDDICSDDYICPDDEHDELLHQTNVFDDLVKQFSLQIKSRSDIELVYESIYNYLSMICELPKKIHNMLDKNTTQLEKLLNKQLLNPLSVTKQHIVELSNTIGLSNIDDIMILNNVNLNVLSAKEKDLINLYNETFTPIGFNDISNVHSYTSEDIELIDSNSMFFTKKIYIKPNTSNKHEELLDNYYSIFIYVGSWYEISGFFKLNPLQIDVRLMTLESYQHIYNKQTEIEMNLLESEKFKRKYLKYCSIQELIIFSTDTFIKYLDVKYTKFNEINNKSFPSLMKEFIGRNMNLLSWYETIKLLLLGSDENINVAGSLFSLLKDKKTNISMVPDIIYDNLVFCNQIKLKKINQTLKIELDKLNELNFESIDLKKELARSTHIPLYVRSLAMEKINEMKLNNNDYNKQLTYVKTILQFPWPSVNDDNIFQTLHDSKAQARLFLTDIDEKLNAITYGHIKVKEQISLLITKWISNPNSSGSAIGLSGPPGVGKTMIAKSLSKVLNIPMVMITLGGQNDSELLIGHGYTYIGAQPGLIIKKMCEANRGRCIMYFDELDKSCAKHGSVNEITSILIHLTDPNTNKTFQDRFFQGVDFPLDKVIFITSYNDSSKIDPILLDRLVELEVKSYNVEDKMIILKNFIIPELKTNIGIDKDIILQDEDSKKFIYDFTAEAGVRDLKHKMEQVLLNINKEDLFKPVSSNQINLDYKIISKFLGDKNRNNRKMVRNTDEIGYINGLYATSNGGGGITSIEIYPIKIGENFQLKLTGSMGDVMKESIQVAFTRACVFIADNSTTYNIPDINTYIKTNFQFGFHIHVPAGATPKDGPSAGAAFTVGFISVLTNTPSDRLVAMTGEMNLSGNVTQIGGLIYKLIGAKYAGITKVLIPIENQIDLADILQTNPTLFDEHFEYQYIDTLSDVVKHVLKFETNKHINI